MPIREFVPASGFVYFYFIRQKITYCTSSNMKNRDDINLYLKIVCFNVSKNGQKQQNKFRGVVSGFKTQNNKYNNKNSKFSTYTLSQS